ncbi:MAG: hypothetical protein L0Y71_22715 [Gemmataceae bacterium]|nr:hypothetical protein [Gemmataceae bacterium]
MAEASWRPGFFADADGRQYVVVGQKRIDGVWLVPKDAAASAARHQQDERARLLGGGMGVVAIVG